METHRIKEQRAGMHPNNGIGTHPPNQPLSILTRELELLGRENELLKRELLFSRQEHQALQKNVITAATGIMKGSDPMLVITSAEKISLGEKKDLRFKPNNKRILLKEVKEHSVAIKTAPPRCFNCQRPGHLKSMCTYAKREYGSCYQCGLMGHQIKNCPQIKLLGKPNNIVMLIEEKPTKLLMLEDKPKKNLVLAEKRGKKKQRFFKFLNCLLQ